VLDTFESRTSAQLSGGGLIHATRRIPFCSCIELLRFFSATGRECILGLVIKLRLAVSVDTQSAAAADDRTVDNSLSADSPRPNSLMYDLIAMLGRCSRGWFQRIS